MLIFLSAMLLLFGFIMIFGLICHCLGVVSCEEYSIIFWSINSFIIILFAILILLKTMWIIPYILYLLIGYICSLKWFPELVKESNYEKKYFTYEGKCIIYIYVLFFPFIFIKRVIKNPYTEIEKMRKYEG